jgi:hypothetical protein
MTATFVFLAINRNLLVASNNEMVQFALAIASSEPDMSWQEIASWLRTRTLPRSHAKFQRALAQLARQWSQEDLRARIDEYNAAIGALEDEIDRLEKAR